MQGSDTVPRNCGGGEFTEDMLDICTVYAENTAQNTPKHATAPRVSVPVAEAHVAQITPYFRRRTRNKRAKGKSNLSRKNGQGGVQKPEVPRLDVGALLWSVQLPRLRR